MRAAASPRTSVRRRGHLSLGLLAAAALVIGLVPTAAAAATPTPTPSATATPATTASPSPSPSASATASPSPTPTATDPDALTTEEMDRLAQDTTADEAIVGEDPGIQVGTATLSGFDAGNIVSDAVFYNSGAMSASQIQTFLNGKVTACRSGYTCLKSYRATTTTRAADAYCPNRYTGASKETAATIIAKVAKACGINPQVLLVMLQKEQGLVTHTWPSDWRYTIAMGMACPDTAACDTAYYGFQNQVYGAARQYQVYAKSSYFNWYPVGKASQVQYHPNASCGSKAVTIRNKATASLYYYTPYQPNAAALRAGYGEGDSCSAYGNRNFYNYFTDWFGSTRKAVLTGMVKAGDDVYLISGGKRIHVTRATVGEYTRTFGSPKAVTASAVSAYPSAGDATPFLRNGSTGHVSLLQGGARHHFASCDLVKAWGSACGKETVLAAADYQKVSAGASVTWFARKSSGGRVYAIKSGYLLPIYNAANLKALAGGSTPYAAVLPSSAPSRKTGLVRWAPGRFAQSAATGKVYLPTWDGRLLHLTSWAYATELGLPRTYDRNVGASAFSGYSRGAKLHQFVKCGSTIYLPARGTLRPVAASAVKGFAVTTLDSRTCAQLTFSKAAPLKKVFVQGVGRDEVYYAQNGKWRHVTSVAALVRVNGGTRPATVRLNAAMVDVLPKGSKIR